ncbi:hypothetical protein [Amycolatopsis speibonae]|uniref:Uncharacterized protein n=1 Tax=Amycolatopsis speibonae TaxID=1450224 RepID=A0ABV7PEA6_9PSEU
MGTDRVVQLLWAPRSVAFDNTDGTREILAYYGFALVRSCSGRAIAATWVPVGENPTFADDEALITTLRAAWAWGGGVA